MKLKFHAAYIVIALSPALAHAQHSPQHFAVRAERFDFVPSEITVRKGTPVTLTLTSQDVAHSLKFKALSVTVNAKKGETKEITFTPDKAGTYIGQCSVFCGAGHGAMKMTLHVTE